MRFKDNVSKEVVETLIKDIAKYILGIEIDNYEFLEKESQRIESRRADVVVKVDNKFILHIEIQNDNDKNMHIRMLRYLSDILLKSEDLPIYQYVIYIGKHKLNMKNNIAINNLNYNYNLIDIKSIDCETLLNIDNPNALVLAILCDFRNKNPKDVVLYILKRLKQLTQDDEFSFRKYILMLEELSENRNLKEYIKEGEKMITDFDYTKLPSFDIGLEKGMERGLQEGLQKGMQKGIVLGLEKGILGIYKIEKNPDKIAELLEEDRELVYQVIEKLKQENKI